MKAMDAESARRSTVAEGCEARAMSFYGVLRKEVLGGNPGLNAKEQSLLRGHYPTLQKFLDYPCEIASAVYASRRSHAVRAIVESEDPLVFDAGCGYGSESFLFAASGARVVSVDRSAPQIAIAIKRKRYFEELYGRSLDITFIEADLNEYVPERGLSLTWIASVMATLQDQGAFLRRLCGSTRLGGRVIITDMNLRNPLFLVKEWRRRKKAAQKFPGIGGSSAFWHMLRRKGRNGARYFEAGDGSSFDDVQFFAPGTLASLLKCTGFDPQAPLFSGFSPPMMTGKRHVGLEHFLGRMPLLRSFGYFYIISGIKGH